MSTIREDVIDTKESGPSIEDATNAFLERWKDPNEASKDGKGAKADTVKKTAAEADNSEGTPPEDEEFTEQDPDESDTNEEDGEEETSEEKPVAKKAASDDDEVTFTVDGVEHKASVKELKRLAGQEAALTRKSQEVAYKTKELDETRALHITALNNLVTRAQERYKPFAEIDFILAAKEMSSEDFAAVRAEAAAAYTDLQFLSEELDGAVAQAQHIANEDFQQRAAEAIQVLSDPKTGIPGWDQKLYNDLRSYAKGIGMAPQVVDTLTDPSAFKLIHKAWSFDNIKKVATAKKATTPKKVMSSSKLSDSSSKNTPNAKSALARLRETGSRESAAEAFMSRWVQEAAD